MQAGETRICVLPFTTPSVEPDGTVRLCSAASTYPYIQETNMGNYREGGLAAVWTNERFREIRSSLLTGVGLKPYCQACEYQHAGSAWLLQLHLALYGYNQTRAERFLPVIERYRARYEEYRRLAPGLGIWVEGLPAPPNDDWAWVYRVKPEVPASVSFVAEGQWADAAIAIPALDVERFVRLEEGKLTIDCRVQGTDASSALNLRVSLEDNERRLAYYFPHYDPARGHLSFAAQCLKIEDGTTWPRRAVRIRIGGFGPAGSSLSIESIEFAIADDLSQPRLSKFHELFPQSEEQSRLEAARLEEEQRRARARLEDLERLILPLKAVFRRLPPRFRETIKKFVFTR